jgi:hypothetical protein
MLLLVLTLLTLLGDGGRNWRVLNSSGLAVLVVSSSSHAAMIDVEAQTVAMQSARMSRATVRMMKLLIGLGREGGEINGFENDDLLLSVVLKVGSTVLYGDFL